MLMQDVRAQDVGLTYGRRAARPAPEVLARKYMPLVRKIGWHVHGRVSNAIDLEDLLQIGMVALVEAANSFEDRGFAFASYAQMRIRGAMIDHLRSHATICRSAMARRQQLSATRARLMQKLRTDRPRGGKECVSTVKSGWSQIHEKK